MRSLENKIPPPVVALVFAFLIWGIAQISPRLNTDHRYLTALAWACVGFGVVVAGSAMLAFVHARTTINPVQIERASSIVSTGVFGLTRNPMYVGLCALLTGWTIYLASPLALIAVLLFIAFTTRFQIVPEERLLAAKFGQEYSDYRARVRRWL